MQVVCADDKTVQNDKMAKDTNLFMKNNHRNGKTAASYLSGSFFTYYYYFCEIDGQHCLLSGVISHNFRPFQAHWSPSDARKEFL